VLKPVPEKAQIADEKYVDDVSTIMYNLLFANKSLDKFLN